MKSSFALLALASLVSCPALHSAEPAPLKPLLAIPAEVALADTFDKAGPVNKTQWGARQGTQWAVEDGVLRGRPSTPEFQAKKKDHFGYEPRISAPVTPAQFVAQFSIRFLEGQETPISPFIEFGHHICRLRFSEAGAEMLADGESVRVAGAKDFHYQPGQWYQVLAEMKGEEVVIQIAGGPVFYAKHPCFAKPVPSGGNGLGVAGPKHGMVEIDDVKIWNIQEKEQPGWAEKRAGLPAFEHVTVKAKKDI